MKIEGLGNQQMYLLPQSIAAFSVSRRLNFTTLGLHRQKLPLSHFFTTTKSSRFYSLIRIPVFDQSRVPFPTLLSEISENSTRPCQSPRGVTENRSKIQSLTAGRRTGSLDLNKISFTIFLTSIIAFFWLIFELPL